MKTYVLYHANCWDGFCAAWICRKALQGEVEFIPVQYGEPEPRMETDATVYLVDFSYPRPAMRILLSQMHKVIVLDHHKTARAELDGLVDEFTMRPDLVNNIPGSELPIIHFDMNKSGGRLTWEHFYPAAAESPPWLVAYTEDRDLWKWELAESKEINANLRSYPLDFDVWDSLQYIFSVGSPSGDKKAFLEGGRSILRRERQIIDDHIRHAREIEMNGHKVLAVNATVLFSEIAGELATGRPFGACYFDRQDGKRQWSLRSSKDGIDVSEIAKSYGGGGHKNAAGFEMSRNFH